MGSPLGSSLVNAFLCHYEKLWLDICPLDFKTIRYRTYLDYIFVLFKFKEHLLSLTIYMKARHENSKFTFNFELSNGFFLDVKITL